MRAEADARGWLERRQETSQSLHEQKQMSKSKCAQAQIETEETLKRALFYPLFLWSAEDSGSE